MAGRRLSGRLAVILHADVADSTALVQQNERLAHERFQDVFQRLNRNVKKYHGLVHELRGDALLAEFERASDAVAAALAFQQAQADYNSRLTDDLQPGVRIGIALGEVVIADNTVTGAGVVLAQRVEQLADAGGVCITEAVREAVPARLPFAYHGLGEQVLKGFEQPVRVHRVGLRQRAGLPLPEPMQTTAHRLRPAVVAALLILIVAVAGLLWIEPWQPETEPASLERMAFPLPDKPSVAVLAFDNLTADPEQVSLADAMSERIITELSRFTELFVIARNSSFTYKGTPVKVQQVAEELGVRYVVEGSLQRSGDRLRVNVQLIDALTGRHLWAERYDRLLEDFFDIQDEITSTVAATVSLKIERQERDRAARKSPASLAAFEAWLLGTRHWYEWTAEGNRKAQQLYEKAIELDPDMARGYAGMAWVYVNNYSNGWSELPKQEILVRARSYAEKALEKAPFDYFPHQTMAYVHMIGGERKLALAETERALELNPNADNVLADSAEALAYAGRVEEALERMQQAVRLNPHHPDWFYWSLGWLHYLNGDYEAALANMQRMTENPNPARRDLAAIYVRLGRLDDARAVIAEFLGNEPEYTLQEFRRSIEKKYADPKVVEQRVADLRAAGLPEKRSPPLPDKPSIAVLPFTNMSGDPEQAYFADGIADDLITDLSRISGLFVIARNSSFSYKDQPVKVRQVAKELGVGYVLEGSVQRAGEQLRINAQLIDATTGGHMWAERYEGSLNDIFALQDQVTQQIVAALEVSLTREETAKQTHHATNNAEAHDAFLQGWAHYRLGSPEDLARAIPFLEKAIDLDNNYGLPHAALASIFWDAWINNWAFDLGMPSFEIEDQIEGHLDRALASPTPLAHDLQARIYLSYSQFDKAVEEAEKAVALDSNDATAHAALAHALILADRPAEGLGFIQHAMRLDPFYPPDYLSTLGAAQFGMENYEDALATFKRAVGRNPDSEKPLIYLASTYGHLGRMREAEDAIETANELRAVLKGLGALSLETTISSGFSAFRGKIDWPGFGTKAAQDRLRTGLSNIPALTWQYLLTFHHDGQDTWAEIEGATKIDLATAKEFHDRGVLFIDLGTRAEGQREKGRVPGAINLPWADYAANNRFRETSLNKILDQTEEVVFYWCAPASTCTPSRATAKAVNWGYQQVYYFKGGVEAWKEAGYPIETDG